MRLDAFLASFWNTKGQMNSTLPIWHPGLSLFNPELDAQHITLLELGNGLVDSVEFFLEADQHCLDLLRDISSLTSRHQAIEEALLEKNCCPMYVDIKAEHAKTNAMFASLIEDAVNSRIEHVALVKNMTNWVRCHLTQSDMAVRQYLRASLGRKC